MGDILYVKNVFVCFIFHLFSTALRILPERGAFFMLTNGNACDIISSRVVIGDLNKSKRAVEKSIVFLLFN
jgi:hypothetical protein